MRIFKLTLILPLMVLTVLTAGCNNQNNNANAQNEPGPGAAMSGTDVTGDVKAASEQGCPNLIDGLIAGDTLIVEMDSEEMKMGTAKITNSTADTSAECAGVVDALPPAEIMSCKTTSSSIPGIKADDELEIAVTFSAQSREVALANLSSPEGITCAFLTLDTLNAM